MRSSIKSGSEVVVISGDDKGKTGKVLRVFPNMNRIVVEGVAVKKRHIRKSQQYPDGAIIEKSVPIHISNVMLKDKFYSKSAKRGL